MIRRTKTMLFATILGLGVAGNQTIANANPTENNIDMVNDNGDIEINTYKEERASIEEAIISLDSIQNGKTYNNENILVGGWAVLKDGAKEVKIYVNNKVVLSGGLNTSRPDVANAHKGYPDGENCGYTYVINKDLVLPGDSTIKVEVVSKTGKTYSKETKITMKKPETLMSIDVPQNASNINNTNINVGGWAVSASSVQGVRVYSDDIYIGNATIGGSRPDVGNIHSSYPNAAKSGYNYTIDKNKLAPGNRKITVEVVNKDGSTKKESRTINITKPAAKASIDSVNNGATINNKNFNVGGWAINASGVKSVRVYVDNSFLGNAVTGGKRPDIASLYGSYPNAATSGYNYTVDISKISIGSHTLTVEVIGNDGTSNKYTKNFHMKKPAPIISIDAPSNGSNVYFKDVNVGGWAIDSSGVKQIKVYLNNKHIKDAALGGSRPDVGKIYSSYPNASKSGYNTTLSKDLFNDGKNTIKIVSYGVDGTTNTKETTVNYSSPPTRISIDTPTANSTVNNKDIKIGGWALEKDGVKEVKVYVDGKYHGTTTTNFARPDVNSVFPGYPGGATSGFNYTIPKSGLAPGVHTVKVEVISKKGKTYTQESKFNLTKPSSLMSIDTLQNGQNISNNKNFNIGGWGIAAEGVKEVKIYSGNTYLGNATLGVRRDDVGKMFPNYPNASTSGFNYTVDINKIAPGNKSFRIDVVSKDGSVASTTRNFTITKPAPQSSIDNVQNGQTIMSDKISVGGWAINASGIREVKVYLNNSYKGSATIGGSRPDVGNAYPGYVGSSNSGYNYSISMDGMPIGNYTIKLEMVGNDGSVSTRSVSFNFGGIVTYTNYNNTLDYYANAEFNRGGQVISSGSGWVPATKDQIKYYLNPDNFTNDNIRKFMFLNLRYAEGITVDNLNSALSGRGILSGKGSAFLEGGKTYNVSPIYLVSHALLETGNGTSQLAKGVVYNGKTVYNMYGIGAVDSNPIEGGAKRAYEEGWFTPEAAIIGGTKWISQMYINNATYNQNTLYKMRWELNTMNHQYATDVGWAFKQTSRIADLISKMNNPVLYFEIPKFK